MSRNPFLKEMPNAGKFWMLILIFLACLIVFNIVGALVMLPFAHVHSLADVQKLTDYADPNVVFGMKMYQIVSAAGTFLVPAILFATFDSDNSASYLHLNVSPKVISILVGALVMLAAMPLINWMADINSKMMLPHFLSGVEQWMKSSQQKAQDITQAFLNHQTFSGFLLNMFIIALLAAVAEEFFFRGVLQKLLIKWTGNIHVGIWIAGALFSFMHFEFYGFLPRMMMGVFLGYLFVWTRSLWAPMFAHFVNNGTAVVLAYLAQNNSSAVIQKANDTASNPAGLLFTLISAVIVAGLVYLIYRTEKENHTAEIPI